MQYDVAMDNNMQLQLIQMSMQLMLLEYSYLDLTLTLRLFNAKSSTLLKETFASRHDAPRLKYSTYSQTCRLAVIRLNHAFFMHACAILTSLVFLIYQ